MVTHEQDSEGGTVNRPLMRLWIDDIRPSPPGFEWHARTVAEALRIVQEGVVEFISFDHDLGPEPGETGYKIALYIEKAAQAGEISRIGWAVHSANPVGAERIRQAMRSADRFWTLNETKDNLG